MKRNTSKFIVICLMMMFAVALVGCGSKGGNGSKGVDGYYVYEKQQGQLYALEISGDTASLYYSVAGGHTIEASVDKTDEGADLYFGKSPSTFLNEWNDFNPMHVKISDDGKKMYLTSDVSGWSALTFEVVSKKDFDEVIDNASLTTQNEPDANMSQATQPVSEPDAEQDRELSEDERNLMDLVTAYCLELYWTGGDEEALKNLTSDETISSFAQGFGLPDEDSALAAAKLLSKYAMELYSTLDPDSPENIVYPGGWDAFYSEYLSFKSDISK